MGWLFGKKKTPQVPFPQGRPLDDKELRLPSTPSVPSRVIQPEQLKEAVGLGKPIMFPEMNEKSELAPFGEEIDFERQSLPPLESLHSKSASASANQPSSQPLFLHIEVYRQVVGQLDDLRVKLGEIQEVTTKLETSEYNEENNFAILKKEVKSMHDRLLNIDKIVFKV